MQQELEKHKQEATKSHTYYKDMVDRCSLQWQKIQELDCKTNLSTSDESTLNDLKSRLTLTIDVDYQMSELIPNWWFSPQPSSAYYLQKLSHDILGIFNHATHTSTIYRHM